MPMSWTNVRGHYGLQKPYDFRVAIPVLLNAVGILAVVIVGASHFLAGELAIGTDRFYFFIYIMILFLAAFVISRAALISLAVFLWCTLELVLALSGPDLLPQNVFMQGAQSTPRGQSPFVYHPVLQILPAPNWKGTFRFDGRNRAWWGPFVTTRLFDHDFTITHNSLGLRGAEITVNDLRKPLIFVYGGSSTYDWSVTQGMTWVEQLHADLNGKFTLLNFGTIVHSTVQHVVHTAFYQDIVDKRPVCAIYYVGWNDLRNVHVKNLDPAYANSLTLAMVVHKPEIWIERYSPLLRLALRAARRRIDSVPEASKLLEGVPNPDTIGRFERIFAEHIRTIVAINASRGIRTVFIGQMLNRDLLNSIPNPRPWFPLARGTDVWPLQERFNSILKATSLSVGANYIDPGIENFRDSDFTDVGHFAAAGSTKFAALISEEVDTYCQ